MRELYQELLAELERDETVAVATIVKRKGSVPREVGAKMLVYRGGRISGTVGGGCGEAEVWRSALNTIDTLRSSTVQVDLTEEIAMESQGVCGGIFDVFVQPWTNTATSHMREYARAITDALESEHAIVLITVVAASSKWHAHVGQQLLIREDETLIGSLPLPIESTAFEAQLRDSAKKAIASAKPHIELVHGLDDNWAELFVEPFTPRPVLLIAGAGHIAAPLAAMASLMNFSVSVTDDRVSFANKERFPTAKRLIVGDIEESLRAYPITSRTHIVLVTRAHSHDVQGLRAIIDSPAAYIGMIGSQRRVWAVFKLLHDEGIPVEKLLRVRAPIGLDLGGSSPEEIALAIMAEITLLRHKGIGTAMSDALRERYKERLKHLDQVAEK